MAENMLLTVGEKLPADCLLEIFSYLSLDDMMQVKNVCRKWYRLSQHWLEQVQTLVFDYSSRGGWELRKNYLKREICFGSDYKKLISILNLYGHHIKYYQIYHCAGSKKRIAERNRVTFQLVPKLCKNIVDLRILEDDESYPASAYKVMATHWEKLKVLYIKYLSPTVGKYFSKLLRNNKQLTTISLVFKPNTRSRVDYEFFTHLPTTIEGIYIAFNSIYVDHLTHFITASKNFTSLQSLKFWNLHYLSDAMVKAIGEIKSITQLTLSCVHNYESDRTANPIAKLKGLRSLDLSHNFDLREDIFINIVESCTQLEQLEIRNFNMLTDQGMVAIAKLKGLKILSIIGELVSTESIISSCASLEVFECSYSEINNSDAIKFLKKATDLRLVDFTFCENLTGDMIMEAKKYANDRKKNILCITGSYGDLDFGEKITPYFKYYDNLLSVPVALFSNHIKHYFSTLRLTEVALVHIG